jgi:hypothetical protein
MGRQRQLIASLKDSVLESLHLGTEANRGPEVGDFRALAAHDAFGGCVYVGD